MTSALFNVSTALRSPVSGADVSPAIAAAAGVRAFAVVDVAGNARFNVVAAAFVKKASKQPLI